MQKVAGRPWVRTRAWPFDDWIGTCFESGKDEVARGEGWAPPFIRCAASNPHCPYGYKAMGNIWARFEQLSWKIYSLRLGIESITLISQSQSHWWAIRTCFFCIIAKQAVFVCVWVVCILTLKAPITTAADDIHKYFFIVFQIKWDLMFQVNPLLGRGFTWNIKPYFLRKVKVKKLNVVCCNFCLAL